MNHTSFTISQHANMQTFEGVSNPLDWILFGCLAPFSYI